MADIQAGYTHGNENDASNYLKSQGFNNPSSGAIRYVAYGDTGYSSGDQQSYGLPMTQNNLIDSRNQAIKPAVDSLTASKPEITNTFDTRGSQLEAEKDPLKSRYQVLLDQITGNQTKDINQQGKVLSTEYGARGIPLSSGAYQQDLANKDTSINQNYSNQYQTTGLARESDLRDLTNQITNLANQKTTALRDVDNQIANLQAGAGNSAVTDALSMYKDSLTQQFASRFDDLNKQLLQSQVTGQNIQNQTNQSVLNQTGGLSASTLKALRGNSGGGNNPNSNPAGI